MSNPVAESMAIVSHVSSDRRRNPSGVVEAWHNQTHPGGFRFCDQQPCHAVNWALRRADVPG